MNTKLINSTAVTPPNLSDDQKLQKLYAEGAAETLYIRSHCPHCGELTHASRIYIDQSEAFAAYYRHFERSEACWEAEQASRAKQWKAKLEPCCDCGRRISHLGRRLLLCFKCKQKRPTNLQRARRAKSKVSEVTCQVCGQTFTPKRSDAKTCSPNCRQKLYRAPRKRAAK